MHLPMRWRRVLIPALGALALLVSCGTDDERPSADAHAEIERLATNPDLASARFRAVQTDVAACLREQGFTPVPPRGGVSSSPAVVQLARAADPSFWLLRLDERQARTIGFGIWDAYAQPPFEPFPIPDRDVEVTESQAYARALWGDRDQHEDSVGCVERAESANPPWRSDQVLEREIDLSEQHERLLASGTYREVADEWSECISAAGVEAFADPESMVQRLFERAADARRTSVDPASPAESTNWSRDLEIAHATAFVACISPHRERLQRALDDLGR